MAANDNALTCGVDLTFEELLMMAIGTDASGKPTLRLYESADTGTDFTTCGKNLDSDSVKKQLFTINAAGKVALRVDITP